MRRGHRRDAAIGIVLELEEPSRAVDEPREPAAIVVAQLDRRGPLRR